MNKKELQTRLAQVGYKFEKLTRFKKHDRLRVSIPSEGVTLSLTLTKHLEETPDMSLLDALLIPKEERKDLR